MAVQWFKTNHKGLRYRKHPKRKHGVDFDRFYQFRHMTPEGRKEESFGWLSEGWTEDRCLLEIAKIKLAKKTGEGHRSLSEKRAEEDRKRAEEAAKQKQIARDALTVSDAWESYSKIASIKKSYSREEIFFRLWIKPIIGDRALSTVAAIHLEKIKKTMAGADLSPRSIQYVLAIIRQLFNYAKKHDLFKGDNPVSKVSMPKFDNRRMRFLSHEEADRLLEELRHRSRQTHDMALLSIYTGMRAGEVFSLTWADVDTAAGRLTLRNTKNSKTRFVFMTENVKAMFLNMMPGKPDDLVFPGRNGGKIVQISETFNRAVNKLGLNEGVTDPRFKVLFHTLRHSFASWMVESGADLYAVKELLGHSDFKMTSRYAHLGANALQAAVKQMESMKTSTTGAEIIPMNGTK